MIGILAQGVGGEGAASTGWTTVAVWLAVAMAGIVLSAIFSGQETGIYTLNRVRLHLLAHREHASAAVLRAMVNRPNRLLGTLLIGNNIANYMATYGIAVLLASAGFGEWQQVLINAAILTPLLFVVGEVLPKDLFARYTDQLSYFFAIPLRYLQIALTLVGLLPLIAAVSRLLSRVLKADELIGTAMHPRRAVTQLMAEGVGHGLLSAHQSDLINRVLHPTEHVVRDAMVPWAQVHRLRVGQPPEAVWALADRAAFSRFPLVDCSGEVLGVVNVFDVLLRRPDDCPPLEQLVRPAPQLAPDTDIREALVDLQRRQTPLAIVTEAGKPIGIVTFKDLVEPITGDLVTW